MENLILSKEELDYQNTCVQYFKKSFSAYPVFLKLVLQKPSLVSIEFLIDKGEQLSDEQIQTVKDNYISCLDKYKEKCYKLAEWCGMHAETFFLDSLDTDICETIYTMPIEYFIKAEKDCETMQEEQSKQYKLSLGLNIIKMKISELEQYNKEVLQDLC